MLRRIRADAVKSERGFTLIELMTVVLIIAVLVAIALPVYWATRERATDRAAQALLTNGVKGAVVVRSDDEPLASLTIAQLVDAEPQIKWLAAAIAPEARDDQLSVAPGTMASGEGVVVISTHTVLGDCLAVRVRETGPTMYFRQTGDTCPASAFGPEAVAWINKWPPR